MLAELVELLSGLVAVDSVNPSLVRGGAGEREIAAFVANWANEAGLEVDVLEGTPGRPSVLVRARGRGGGATLLLCGHLDTVTTEGMADPHTPRVAGDRLHGRGAYDMKAGLAAALIACREAAGRSLAGDVLVAAVADEEHASLGIQEVLATIRADGAIVTEPTALDLVVAHKGFVWSEIEVTGRAAHGSRPDLGDDAIAKAGPILTAIGELDRRLCEREHPLLGRPSLHASTIEGGEELSSYPARCTIGIERRTLPGETIADLEAELASLLVDGAVARTLLVRQPFELDPASEFVALVRDTAAEVVGRQPIVAGAPYWADSGFIAAAGIPVVLFGPGGEGAHAAEEWVSIADTAAVTRVLVTVAERFCA